MGRKVLSTDLCEMSSGLFGEKSSVMGLYGSKSPRPLGLQLSNSDKRTLRSTRCLTTLSFPLQTLPTPIQKAGFGDAAEMCNCFSNPCFCWNLEKAKHSRQEFQSLIFKLISERAHWSHCLLTAGWSHLGERMITDLGIP